MGTLKKISLLAIAIVLCYVFLNQVLKAGPPPPPCGVQLEETETEGKYELSCLPALETTSNTEDTAFWRVFYSTGDGRFWIGTLNDFKNVVFADNSGTTNVHTPFAEYTAAYDDSENPKKTHRNQAFVLGDVGDDIMPSDDFYVDIENGHSRLVKLQSTSDPSPSDSLIYIITYQGSNLVSNYDIADSVAVEFKYDSNKLIYIEHEKFRDETIRNSVNSTTHTGTVRITSKVKPGPDNQRNVFLFFKANSSETIIGQAMSPAPNVHYFIYYKLNNIARTSDIDEDILSGQPIVASHDPSYKTIFEIDSTDNFSFIDFSVHIQNDGNARIDKIIIEDYLDVFFRDTIGFPPFKKIPGKLDQTIMASKYPVKIPSVAVVDRSHTFYWDNLNLRGMREAGLGHTFTETDTKAWFTFRCFLDTNYLNHRPDYACNAICNQARITFGCTPVSKTNIVQYDLKCNTGTECTSSDTTINLQTLPDGQTILPPDLITYLTDKKFLKFKWYPAKGLSDSLAMNPVYTKNDLQEYTLVASNDKNCERLVVHLHLPLCQLGFSIHNVCEDGDNYLIATAENHSGDGQQLVWQNCEKGKTLKVPIYSDTELTFYFGLTDTTGCTAEANFQLANLRECKEGQFWTDLLLIVVGILLAFLVIRSVIPSKAPDDPV